MSLLNSMIKAAASSLISENPELLGKVATLLNTLFTQTGGLSGLIHKFQENGLEDIINSWMSDEEKLPISTEQIGQVIGKDFIDQLASQADLDSSIFEVLLAKGLPKVVSQLTQKGQISPQEAPSLSLETAQELVEQLFS